jgi:hypothetical protein
MIPRGLEHVDQPPAPRVADAEAALAIARSSSGSSSGFEVAGVVGVVREDPMASEALVHLLPALAADLLERALEALETRGSERLEEHGRPCGAMRAQERAPGLAQAREVRFSADHHLGQRPGRWRPRAGPCPPFGRGAALAQEWSATALWATASGGRARLSTADPGGE